MLNVLLEGKRAYMASSTFTFYLFHHAFLVRFVTSVSCLNHTLFFLRVWSLRKGSAQARPSLQEVN